MIKGNKQAGIKESLLADIFNGKYKAGDKLAGDSKLASQWGISPTTVRLALEDLEREGAVRRVHGSGTYVTLSKPGTISINVPIEYPKKVLTKHWLGKMSEHAHRSSKPIRLEKVHQEPVSSSLKTQWQVAKLFTSPQPAGCYEITMNELPALVEAGLCEDLTSKFSHWPQANNVYQMAISAVTCNSRIYGLPFHCSLSGLLYNKEVLHRADIDPAHASRSLDDLARAIEKLAKDDSLEYTFWDHDNTRMLVMHLVRAFYDNPRERFFGKNLSPIEREIGIEVLEFIKRLKWKLRARIFGLGEHSESSWRQGLTDLTDGRSAMSIGSLVPLRHLSSSVNILDFATLSFSPKRKPVSLFNTRIWIINPNMDQPARTFLWSFLQDYVSPQSEYEIDRRYLEEGDINLRMNPFIRGIPRVPDDLDVEERKRELFTYAEPEIPFPTPVFDFFVMAVYRMLFDADANAKREYDFYCSLVQQGSRLDVEAIWQSVPTSERKT